jgi:enoyl-CoA hydratase
MRVQERIAALVTGIHALQPFIAAVNGPAAGGGLALASDVRIAGESARFGDAFVRIRLSGCDIGVSWMLPRRPGPRSKPSEWAWSPESCRITSSATPRWRRPS